MASAVRALIAGNWKMNGRQEAAAELVKIINGARAVAADLLVCPPATLIAGFAALARGTAVAIGAQDCHAEPAGAFTGDISAEMLKDAGATSVIVGHSERRIHHRETDADVRAKASAARRAGLAAIICIGETGPEREAGRTIAVVSGQLDGSLPEAVDGQGVVIAYEPVWAIGSGRTPTTRDIAEVHGVIRQRLTARCGAVGQGVRIIYGGSVKPANAREILQVENVNGALVGGASLKAEEFLAIASVCR
jgi:triosephosphate isomerase